MEIAFNISIRAIFGDGVLQEVSAIEMEDHITGELKTMSFYEGVQELIEGCFDSTFSPVRVIFPTLVKFNIGKANHRNVRNAERMHAALEKMAELSENASFLEETLMSKRSIDKASALHDFIVVIFGAMDLPSKWLSQILLRFKRSPEFLAKITAELDEHFPDIGESPEKLGELLTIESLDKLEYLSRFLKETLRF